MAFGNFEKVIVSGSKIKVVVLLWKTVKEKIRRNIVVGIPECTYYIRPENPSVDYVP